MQADIARRALAALSIRGAVTPTSIEEARAAGGEERADSLDDEYYICDEPIADRLFAFVKANRSKNRLV